MAALAPVACAAVLTVLLSSYVIAGGGGTISRVRIEVTLAAIPMPAFTALSEARSGRAPVYVTIRNLSGSPDQLVSASSPAAAQIVFTRRGSAAGSPGSPGGFRIPAHGSVTLSPFGPDIVLLKPDYLQAGQTVPLTLTFREAGAITIDATVTPPGAP